MLRVPRISPTYRKPHTRPQRHFGLSSTHDLAGQCPPNRWCLRRTEADRVWVRAGRSGSVRAAGTRLRPGTTLTGAPLSAENTELARGARCVSISHKSEVTGDLLARLRM